MYITSFHKLLLQFETVHIIALDRLERQEHA